MLFKFLTPLFISDHIEQILYRLSEAIVSAINGTCTQRKFIPHVLRDLIKLETSPWCLTKTTYEWCSVICENRQNIGDLEGLLLACLEIGFRDLDYQDPYVGGRLTHTEHHRELVNVVFKSRESESIADLLYAWTARDYSLPREYPLLGICAGHLINLHDMVPFSSRLRRLVIRSVELIGHEGFEEAGMDRFIGLLNHLQVTTEDIDIEFRWAILLLGILRSSEGAQRLSHWYWELLMELAISVPRSLRDGFAYSPQITTLLTETQEWSKLECWIGVVSILWPPGADGITEEDLERSMQLLFRQRPDAAQRLEQWMGRWSENHSEEIPESFQRICRKAHEAAPQDTP